MKKFITVWAVIIFGYLLTVLINMGVVLLFFQQRILEPVWLLVILEALIIVTTSVALGYSCIKLFKLDRLLPVSLLIVIVAAVMCLNIYLDNSLEPLWYKIIYLLCFGPGTYYGARRACLARSNNP